jgi:hypothetical protein
MTKRIFISADHGMAIIAGKENQMKIKFSSIILLLTFLLTACGAGTPALVTHTPVTTQPPTDIPTQTAIPFPTIPPSPTAVPPYPTASVVKSNAVAFISYDEHYNTSLWVANVDGSGERRLVESLNDKKWDTYGYAALRWSPNGKWISYLSSEELWIVSSDGLINKKVLSSDKDKGTVYMYQWSPDSSQIAYVQSGQSVGLVSDVPIVVGLLDLETGKTSELSSYKSPTPVTFSWAHNGRYLLLSKMDKNGFLIFDVNTRKFIKEIISTANCSLWHHGVLWSPNSNWFYDIPSQNGRFATTQICVAGLDGSHRQIDINGTATSSPVWDKTGNFLYYVAGNTNFSITPIPDYDIRLMRYNVRTQKQERLLSLGKEPQRWSISMSPDNEILELHTSDSGNPYSFAFLNIKSLSVTKFNLELKSPPDVFFRIYPAWTPDSKNIILYFYRRFYSVNIQTGEATTISGIHSVNERQWAVSPIATTP